MSADRRDAARAFGQTLRAARLERGISQEQLTEGGDFDRTYPSLLGMAMTVRAAATSCRRACRESSVKRFARWSRIEPTPRSIRAQKKRSSQAVVPMDTEVGKSIRARRTSYEKYLVALLTARVAERLPPS